MAVAQPARLALRGKCGTHAEDVAKGNPGSLGQANLPPSPSHKQVTEKELGSGRHRAGWQPATSL